jgi:hypothetical protein
LESVSMFFLSSADLAASKLRNFLVMSSKRIFKKFETKGISHTFGPNIKPNGKKSRRMH